MHTNYTCSLLHKRSCILALFFFLATTSGVLAQCGCDFTIPAGAGTYTFNGTTNGVQPGDVICISGGTRERIVFQNIVGSAANYVTIKNCNGQVLIGSATANNGITFTQSRHFRVTGTGDAAVPYGIKITEAGSGKQGIAIIGFSSDFEIDHIEVTKVGFAGIMAKVDPSTNCADKAPERPNYLLSNVKIHHNYFHDIGGEGIYLGNSFYRGTTVYCGSNQYPHEVRGVRIHDNLFQTTGWESIQVGSAVEDVEIYNNRIYNYGAANNPSQNGGIQMGLGTTGRLYNNFVKGGTGPALVIQGIGENYVYNNIVVNAGAEAINVNTRSTPLATDIVPNGYLGGVYVMNNTIVSAGTAAIKENLNDAPGNVLYNNLIVACPAAWDQTKAQYDWTKGNNVVIPLLANALFENAGLDDYRVKTGSPAINTGRDLSTFGVIHDMNNLARPSGGSFDVGAFELSGNLSPVVVVGPNQNLTLPTTSTSVTGSATDIDGTIASYLWTKTSGPAATMGGTTSTTLALSNLVAGTYVFRLSATDNGGATGFREMTIIVLDPSANQSPVANAGADKSITLPVTSTTITGSGTDPDGSIASYSWTQVAGTAATLVNTTSATLTVNNLSTAGTRTFRLTVTDDDGATDTDDIIVTVNPAATNSPPVANAGADKNLVLPTNSVTVNGTGSDPDGTIASYLWTKLSGPAVVMNGGGTANLSLSGMVEGIYTFRLTVTDNGGLTHSDNVSVNVSAANQPPVANAGADKTITLPTNSTTLTGIGTDVDGSIASYSWIKVNALAATLANANSATLTVTNMVQGTYTFRLTVTDDDGATHSNDVVVVVEAANVVPNANAGADQTVILPTNSLTLAGSATDPDGSIASYLWVKVSGPTVTLGATNASALDLSNLIEGVYTFRLTVTDDDGGTDFDNVVVNVLPASINQAPIVNAGTNITLTLPVNSADLTGVATDVDGTISAFLWTKISGPAATLAGTATATLSLTNLLEGVYRFRFSATDDDGATAIDDVFVTVTASNQPPNVDAGVDQSLLLPTNATTLIATASDPDGTISSYLWTKEAGGAATLTGETTANLDLSDLVQGSYIFRVTVTDNDGSQSIDDVKVVVQSATNATPTVNAGADINVFLPTNTINITATASDTDGTIQSYLWEQVGGGTAATLVNATTATITINDLLEDVYVFRVTVTDNLGATEFDEVTVAVFSQSTNQPPRVDAGPNITLSLPVNTTNLIGSASDADGTIVSYAWIKVSGPTVTMQNPNSAVASLSQLVEGVYIFRLTATDDAGAAETATCQVTVLPSFINQSPIVNAGNDITLTLPTNSVTILALASDNDGSIATYDWTKQIGPASTVSGASTANLQLSNLVEGVYVYRITVTDNQGSSNFDEINITILAAGSNQPPSVNAGTDKVLFLPDNALNLAGSASDEGGSITTYEWLKIQGPSVTLTNANTTTLSISNLVAGQYVFRLTATDNDDASAFDEVVVTVFPGTVNQSPIANAGANQTIVWLPNTTATLSGSGFDPDGSIVSYSWTQVLGATSTLENVSSATMIVSGLDEGTYEYQLTVTDDDGSEGADIIIVTVVAEGANQPPVAEAGFDQVVYLPDTDTQLTGSAFDPDGVIASVEWLKKTGPSVTMAGQTTLNLNLTNLLQGSYRFTLSATDNLGLSNGDEIGVTVFPGGVNSNPSVNAGSDVFIRSPQSSSTLTAVATDPNGTIISYQWTKVSGPAATLSGVNSSTISISNLVEGVYVFKVDVADDGGATASDDVKLTVAPPGVNNPPVVSSGAAASILPPTNTIVLTGSAFDLDGTIVSLQWTQVDGPSTATLTGSNSTTLNASNLILGQYTFRLTAVDNENASSFSDVIVDVREANIAPTIVAINDTTLYLPTNFISFEGLATDPDGFVVDYEWSQINGSPADMNVENLPVLAIANMLEGTYTFQFTATDNLGATTTEDVTVTLLEDPVNPIGASKIFSPNNDAVNDVWVVRHLSMITDCPILIFNRLGQKVFEATSYSNDWDATISGRPLDEGDYYYVIECNNVKKYSGAIRLIR